MSVTESPKFGPCLPEGTFIVFSFDPAAYARELNDDTAVQNASKIERKKYLGLIESLGPLDLPKMRLNFNIRVVGFVPPQEGEDDMYCTSPARCIPIHPSSAHPEERAPLVPSNPLPWSEGCYLHTLQLVNAFVSRIHHTDPAKLTAVTAEEMTRVSQHVIMDQYEASPRRCGKGTDHDGDASESSGSYYASDEGDSESQAPSVDDPFVKPLDVYIEIWEDLSVAKTLGEPKNVGADIDEIVAVGEEWEKRKNYEFHSKAPETLQWAEGVVQAGNDDPNSALEGNARAAAHEDDIKPEDAIDEKIERARRGEVGTPKEDTSNAQDATLESECPARLVVRSPPGCASTTETAGDDEPVNHRGPLQFATAKARHLKDWLRQTLRV